MDKIKDMLHGGHKKEGEQTTTTTTHTTATGAHGYGEPVTTGTTQEGTGEKKHGLFGLGGHKKDGGSSSSSSSDEEREGASERNRIRREKRAQRTAAGVPIGTTGTVPMGATGGHVITTGAPMAGTGEKKHGFFG